MKFYYENTNYVYQQDCRTKKLVQKKIEKKLRERSTKWSHQLKYRLYTLFIV